VTGRNLIANNGTQTYMLRGTDVEQHVVQIDGADMVSSRQGRTETVRLPTNAVADSQVKTGGADATSPAGLGVVFNVTTRVGTNRLSGTAGVHHQNRGWNADNDPRGIPAIAESSEVEASLGGPIRVDRAWFFGSYFYLHRNSPTAGMSSTGASAASPPSRNGFTCRPWGVASSGVASR